MTRRTEHEPDWSRGCPRIVPTVATLQRDGKSSLTTDRPAFEPGYTFLYGDERIAPCPVTGLVPPRALQWAAWDYQRWIEKGARGSMPEFGHAVETLCTGRVTLEMGLGSLIYCELASDAKVLRTYFSDPVSNCDADELDDPNGAS